ncbi:MAG: hypothetical protein ROO71_08175 [Balneola sp.]
MPFVEFLTGYVAKKAMDKFIFTEKNVTFLKKQVRRKGFAEKNLLLDSVELAEFYSTEELIKIELAGKEYLLPMVLGIDILKEIDFVCEIQDELYLLDKSIHAYTDPIKERAALSSKTVDGRVVRLDNITGNTLHLRKASYYDSLSTNFAMDYVPNNRKESLREYLHGREHKLQPFDQNKLVNHLGVVCMVESSDGQLIVQKRNSNVINRSNTLSASFSGAINWSDLQGLPVPFGIEKLMIATIREAREELNSDIHDIVFLGMLRELKRGGKPELYYFAKSKKTFLEIDKGFIHGSHNPESKGFLSFEFYSDRLNTSTLEQDRFKNRVKSILEDVEKKANLTLVAGIVISAKELLLRDQ